MSYISPNDEVFIPFGSDYVKTLPGSRRELVFSITNGGVPSDQYVPIGGVPLSTSKLDYSFYNILNIIQDYGHHDYGDFTVINGNSFKLLRKDSLYAIGIQTGSGGHIPVSETTIEGMPLALNSEKEFIVNLVTPSSVDEYASTVWGGHPIKIARVWATWYLVMPI